MLKLIAVLAALSLAACVDDASPPDDTTTLTEVTAEPLAQPSRTPDGVTPNVGVPTPSVCDMLASTDAADPCAHLCDDDFASYLPPHTCVELACPLTDGSIYRAGGCTP